MKKFLALVLALVLALSMASVAFAHNIKDPDQDCILDGGHLTLGEAFKLSIDKIGYEDKGYGTVKRAVDRFINDYNIKDADMGDLKASVKWTKGGAMVDSVYFDKDEGENGYWMLKLKENYTIDTAKDLEGEITFEGKGKLKDLTFKGEDTITLKLHATVANHVVMVYGEEEKEDAKDNTIDAHKNTIYKCEEDEAGYVSFNNNSLLSVMLNMASEEKAFMYNDEAVITELEEKFPEAEIECYNFGGAPTFKNEAEFTLQADYADQYFVYTWDGKKLEAQDYDWDSIEGVYTWSTKSPKSYVISDVELVAAAEDSKNPDTGANDVVGVAAALAVVSLVAGAAVSLKK